MCSISRSFHCSSLWVYVFVQTFFEGTNWVHCYNILWQLIAFIDYSLTEKFSFTDPADRLLRPIDFLLCLRRCDVSDSVKIWSWFTFTLFVIILYISRSICRKIIIVNFDFVVNFLSVSIVLAICVPKLSNLVQIWRRSDKNKLGHFRYFSIPLEKKAGKNFGLKMVGNSWHTMRKISLSRTLHLSFVVSRIPGLRIHYAQFPRLETRSKR